MKKQFDSIIEKAIFDWVSKETGITVIWDKENELRPSPPYIVVSFLTGTVKEGSSDNLTHKENGTFIISGQRKISLSINCYAKNSLQILSKLQTSTEKPSVQELLRNAGLAIWEVGEVRDLSELLETGYENRSQMNVVLGLCQSTEDEVGIIESTKLKATLNNKEIERNIP